MLQNILSAIAAYIGVLIVNFLICCWAWKRTPEFPCCTWLFSNKKSPIHFVINCSDYLGRDTQMKVADRFPEFSKSAWYFGGYIGMIVCYLLFLLAISPLAAILVWPSVLIDLSLEKIRGRKVLPA